MQLTWERAPWLIHEKYKLEKFERVVAAIHRAQVSGGEVRWNDVINGRQFDLTIRFKFGLHDYLTVIECKHYSGRVSVETVDALVTKARDVQANKAILVSSNGYQSGCIPVAERHGISLLVLSENIAEDVSHFADVFVPALNIYGARLVLHNGELFEFEDVAGRLAYLMSQSRVMGHSGATTPNELIRNWQLSKPSISLKGESSVSIELDAGARISIPHDGEFEAKRFEFKCEIIQAALARGPMVDRRLLSALATEFQLSDVSGNLLQTASMRDLDLGEPDGVRPDHFYSQPELHIHYYCLKIIDGLATWIIVESYQHGHLFQATATQKIEHSKHYLEVTDKRLLTRLRSMLKEYLQHNAAKLEK